VEYNRPMTKARWLGPAALLAMVVFVVAVVWIWPPAEPSYKGKALHYWLQGYTRIVPPSFNSAPRPTESEADDAIRGMGTNAIPALLRILVYRESPLIRRLLPIAQRLHVMKVQYDPPWSRNYEAVNAFRKLVEEAAGATPELIQMYDTHPDSLSRQYIVTVLGLIGPKANEAVSVLLRAMTSTNYGIRINAAGALGKIHSDPDRVVPALMLCLNDGNPILQRNAIWSLTQFGRDAQPAVSALLQFLENAKYNPATAPVPQINNWAFELVSDPGAFGPASSDSPSVVTDAAAAALWVIDPAAAAQGQIRRPE
jgi:hypothetical protein